MSWDLIFPFVSRSRYNDLKAERDRIDAERKLYLDRLAALNLGGTFFSQPEPQTVAETPAEAAQAVAQKQERARSIPFSQRPSQIVAQQTARAFDEYYRRRRSGAEVREMVMKQFDTIEKEVINNANG